MFLKRRINQFYGKRAVIMLLKEWGIVSERGITLSHPNRLMTHRRRNCW